MQVPERRPTRQGESWPWVSVMPLGLGAWAPIYAGVRARRALWWTLGLLWSLITIAGWVLSTSHGHSSAGGGLIVVGWVGAIATSFTIRSSYSKTINSSFEAALHGAADRLAEREQGRKLALKRPQLARELGIGRPDLPDAHDAGVIDVNNASAAALAELPGIDDARATRIVETRAEVNGFSSVEDLGLALNLDPQLVEGLRERAVFLPR